jgi:UDP-N-acetylglucosamine 4,6-dehydratase/5-epimerase
LLEGRVLITGGGGFIARALYRRAISERWPCTFIAIGRSDGPLREVQERYAEVVEDVKRVNVTDTGLLHQTVYQYLPDGVVHAAAAKYVDLSELNAWDTAMTNVEGSSNVLRAAIGADVRWIVAISTDKACMPVNTYGATKFLMERLYQEASNWGTIRSTVCRYGNVIGSTGSALPRMRKSARDGAIVRVTNPEMTRFWMTPDQAVDTILAAADPDRSNSGEVVIYPAGASALLTAVHGAVGDMRQVTIGERPGEKVHETLLTAGEGRRSRATTSRNWPGDRGMIYLPRPGLDHAVDAGVPELRSDMEGIAHWSAAEIAIVLDELEADPL